MSDIYNILISLTPNDAENTNNDKNNDSKISNIDWEIQKVCKLHCSKIYTIHISF